MPGEAEVPLWQRWWFQWLLAALATLIVASFVLPPILRLVYTARPVLLPVLVAFGLAYIFNPLVRWAKQRLRIPRWLGTTSVMLSALLTIAIGLLLVGLPVIEQAKDLIRNVDHYAAKLIELVSNADRAGSGNPDPAAADLAPAGQAAGLRERLWNDERLQEFLQTGQERLAGLKWGQIASFLRHSLDLGIGAVGSAISLTSYAAVAVVVIGFCFFFFSWKFDQLTAWFVPFIPEARRRQTIEVISKMDQSVSAFIRGRLIQASVMGATLSIGWYFAGVPYWLLLGVLSGALNLIPYAAVVGWLAATILATVHHLTGDSSFTVWVLVWPTVVYIVAQLIDGWVVEPLVQGKATDLDPMTVLLVVLVGGSLAGLLGMILAIPLAACVKILAREVVLPKLRSMAATAPAPAPGRRETG